jgi:hypothetical protein
MDGRRRFDRLRVGRASTGYTRSISVGSLIFQDRIKTGPWGGLGYILGEGARYFLGCFLYVLYERKITWKQKRGG